MEQGNKDHIFEALRAAANPGRAAEMRSYMRDQFIFLGIPTPQRRKLTAQVVRTRGQAGVDWEFVFRCWDEPEREFQYLAVDYLIQRKAAVTPADMPRLERLIVTKSWWDTVDALDRVVGAARLAHPELDDILLRWSVSDNIWLRRTAIDHQLTLKDQTDTALLERILVNNLGQTEFFINKAIGWSLRDYSKTDPEWVRAFIARHRDGLAALSVREASKYL